jgi:hypothetical protein
MRNTTQDNERQERDAARQEREAALRHQKEFDERYDARAEQLAGEGLSPLDAQNQLTGEVPALRSRAGVPMDTPVGPARRLGVGLVLELRHLRATR